MINLFFGHDENIQCGTTAFLQSVIEHASEPIAITPITRKSFPEYPEGSNAFTLRRFLVPHIMGYNGWALFVDGADMVCRGDITEIFKYRDNWKAVHVVKHDYTTKYPRKYLGTSNESDNHHYLRKQWASVMLINCGHSAWKLATPEIIIKQEPNMLDMLQFRFIDDDRIGDLPIEWNWLCDEFGENRDAKLLHYTAGIPFIEDHDGVSHADEWWESFCKAQEADICRT